MKIANSVPGKTREECLARYKHLVEIVKAQKERAKPEEQSANDEVISNQIVDDRVEKELNDEEELEESAKKSQHKGKPRNKRKERKNRMDFSSDEDYDFDSN